MGLDGLRGLERGGLLPAAEAAGEQQRRGRPPRPLGPREAARRAPGRSLRRGAARGVRAGRHPDRPVQLRDDRHARRELVPDRLRREQRALLVLEVVPPSDHGQAEEPRGSDGLPRQAPSAGRRAPLHRRGVPEPRPHPLDPGRCPPRGDLELRVDRRPQAAHALGHRPGRAPTRVRDRRDRRLPGRGRAPRGPPRGPRHVGGQAADGDDLHPVVGDRHLHDDRGGPRSAEPDVSTTDRCRST